MTAQPPWAPTARLWLLAFDVADAKVRRRLERLFKRFGFQSTQYSLRLSMLTPGELTRLKGSLRAFSEEELHLILLPLGAAPPSPFVWGQPLGLSQRAWNEEPGGPPCLHVDYPPHA